ncbi:MAG TPA: hypothetical protein DIT42_06415 [Gammaproteobacteria bacterium]|uniref:Exo-alpha-sialidase n=4 Tax=OM182 clade TaxID=745002 RepID=A0A0R2T9A3_9GAMM|nr:MAG: hypothetical protein ABR85_09545 [OM182 bacterium BACL3 MAG-120619-bin3]KRO85734.1 MAG: hypothetical protein ABR72_10495 [OM182 bacterium BACL3 MAG-120920-bin41]KRP29653.1 MAG: hypothetical protein ABS30_02895 [OM182 bacterium BACL3 MAG-120924-bin41]MDP4661091.1 hypothetical protein [OM182 bacterium]HCO10766.1 hypothetical protein [Gammaproteobacteria bacterium]
MVARRAPLLAMLLLLCSVVARGEVFVTSIPDGGLQPRLVTAADGGVHLLYFKKRLSAPSAREGNLYYREYLREERRFGLPIKVSSTAFNLQTFAIARASMAIDGEGRAHVIWYLPRENRYLYARSDVQRLQFEEQRSLVSAYIEGVDAAADVAAEGNQVAIVWGAGALSAEQERTVYARFSDDGGESFGAEQRVGNKDLGACACCSLAAEFDPQGRLSIAYRSAIDGVGRHMQWLTLHAETPSLATANEALRGDYSPLQPLQEWEMSSCPLSTNDFALDTNGEPWVAFETAARIIRLKANGTAAAVQEPATQTRQKNPSIAVAANGDVLTAWGEAISHSKGGALRAQLEDANGVIIEWELGTEITLPNFSFPAAAAIGGNDFLLLW